MQTRTESDSMGEVQVPECAYYGAQTARSLRLFQIGTERIPTELVRALAIVKKSAAIANARLGLLTERESDVIQQAAQDVIDGRLDGEFPLPVWQSGSGTHTNMNLNEVIANRAIELSGGTRGSNEPIHPLLHVNRSQSSNDVFSTAIQVATVLQIEDVLLPSLRYLKIALSEKARAFGGIVKVGRTHMQDCTPLTLGQEISGWAAQLDMAELAILANLPLLRRLPLGGTTVGTGVNAPKGFAEEAIEILSELTGQGFEVATNKFALIAAHDCLVSTSGSLKQLASALMKIAGDIRWLASGPRCGLSEISIPSCEPTAELMPGKTNPAQAEALAMLCCQVMGNDVTLSIAASQGNLELNTFKTVIAHNVLQSIRLLADGCRSFCDHCALGITANRVLIERHLQHSLVLAAALESAVGHEDAVRIVQHAHATGGTLRDSALALGILNAKDYDELVRPERMIGPIPELEES